MLRHTQIVTLIAVGATVAACGTTERVNFVTTTSIGIQGDTRTADATIGYNRFEGVIGPAYETGALPPVAAALNSDLEIFNPSISQVYATGDAARLVTGGKGHDTAPKLKGAKRVMVFGAGTTVGAKFGFGTSGPESIVFGYKRIEFSSLPIGKKTSDANGEDKYGSVLASIDLDVDGDIATDKTLKLAQLFASGEAATELAKKPELQELFKGRVEQILGRNLGCVDKIEPDDNTTRIEEFIDEDREKNEALVRDDMKLLQIEGVSLASMLGCKAYKRQREMIASLRNPA